MEAPAPRSWESGCTCHSAEKSTVTKCRGPERTNAGYANYNCNINAEYANYNCTTNGYDGWRECVPLWELYLVGGSALFPIARSICAVAHTGECLGMDGSRV